MPYSFIAHAYRSNPCIEQSHQLGQVIAATIHQRTPIQVPRISEIFFWRSSKPPVADLQLMGKNCTRVDSTIQSQMVITPFDHLRRRETEGDRGKTRILMKVNQRGLKEKLDPKALKSFVNSRTKYLRCSPICRCLSYLQTFQ